MIFSVVQINKSIFVINKNFNHTTITTKMLKTITVNTLLLLSSLFIFNSCSKSDDNSSADHRGSPSALIAGSYHGVFGSSDSNKILIVEDKGNNTVRLSGNGTTPVELQVEYFDTGNNLNLKDVKHKTGGERIGILTYTHETGYLTFSGYRVGDNQVRISFKGNKVK